MASNNASFEFVDTTSSSEGLANISSQLVATVVTTDATDEASNEGADETAVSMDTSVDSFIVEVARPPMAVFGSREQFTEEEVLATLALYGRQDGKRSFLESLCFLSGSSPDCHPLAVPYLTDSFKAIKKALALECYQLFNTTLFKGMLPREEVRVRWTHCHAKTGVLRAPHTFRLHSHCVDDPFKVANAMLMLVCLAATDGTERDGTTRNWDMWSELAKAMYPELLQPTAKRLAVVHFEMDVFLLRTPLPSRHTLPTL